MEKSRVIYLNLATTQTEIVAPGEIMGVYLGRLCLRVPRKSETR